jgi:hypothetical protein
MASSDPSAGRPLPSSFDHSSHRRDVDRLSTILELRDSEISRLEDKLRSEQDRVRILEWELQRAEEDKDAALKTVLLLARNWSAVRLAEQGQALQPPESRHPNATRSLHQPGASGKEARYVHPSRITLACLTFCSNSEETGFTYLEETGHTEIIRSGEYTQEGDTRSQSASETNNEQVNGGQYNEELVHFFASPSPSLPTEEPVDAVEGGDENGHVDAAALEKSSEQLPEVSTIRLPL